MICLRCINLEDTMDGFSYELSKCESIKILKINNKGTEDDSPDV